jgi:hypothetical protein
VGDGVLGYRLLGDGFVGVRLLGHGRERQRQLVLLS